MRPERKARFEEVLANRQGSLTLLLENVKDPHNIAAILRSADSVGVQDIYLLDTDNREIELAGRRAARSAEIWTSIHSYNNLPDCVAAIRNRGYKIWGTHLGSGAHSLYEMDLTGRIALAFGNERYGLSNELLDHCEGNFMIPQKGMIRSLNVSVACAVTLYEAYRQRQAAGMYDGGGGLDVAHKKELYARWTERYNSQSEKGSID